MSYGQLLARYRKKHGKFVEPHQGFASLHESLWLAYSIGRKRGFTDLGTYVNKPGDHGGHPRGRPPAWAFDLGRNNRFYNRGWNYLVARRLAKRYWKHHQALNIEYVILGMRVISRNRPYWHRLGTGDTSHMFHLHISGHDPGWSV